MMIGDYAKFTANTGLGLVAVANTNLDGSGTLATVLTAADSGTIIKTLTIKAIAGVAAGDIIRLFVYNGTTNYLLQEIQFVPTGGGASSVFTTASMVVTLNFPLKATYVLKASTDAGKKFNVIAEGVDITYP